MSTIGYWSNLLAAVRNRKPSDNAPAPRSVTHPYYFNIVAGKNRPQPKVAVNFTKLRSFSESPIPRRAIDYIKNQISMLDWYLRPVDKTKSTALQQSNMKKIRAILTSPNSHESWRTFIEQIVEDMLVMGYCSVEKRPWYTNPWKPLVMYPFDAASLNMYTDWDSNPTSPKFAQVKSDGTIVNFTDDQIMVMRYNPRTNNPWGLSPLEVAATSIDYLLNTQAYAARRASNATPDFILDLGEEIDQDQVKEVRQWWTDEVEGRGRTPIIGGGKGAKSINIGAGGDEELFLKWQDMMIRMIANSFGLDQAKFGAVLSSRATGDIMDDVSDEGAIRPLAHTIAASINRDIIQALGFEDIEFCFRFTANYEDRKSLANIHQIYGNMDALTIDEIREELGRGPLADGKGQYTVTEYRALYGENNSFGGQPGGVSADQKKAGMNPNVPGQQSKNTNATPPSQTSKTKPVNQTRNNLKS